MEHIYLSHHGIKGQKWGVRRFQLKNGRLTSAGKKRYAEDDDKQKKKEDSKPKVKPISEMSDDELRAKISRIELERKYQSYLKDADGQQKVSEGSKFVKGAKDIGKKVLLDPMVDASAKYVKDYLYKQVDKRLKDPEKSIKELKSMNVEKMGDGDLKRLAERLTNEAKVLDSKRNSNDRSSTLKDLKEISVENLTGDQLKSVLNRKGDEVKLDKLNKGENTNMTKEDISELVREEMEKQLNHSDIDYDSVDSFLSHHGIKGQKWGVRRYQNDDGTLTKAGKRRRTTTEKKENLDEKEKTSASASWSDYATERYLEKNLEKMSTEEYAEWLEFMVTDGKISEEEKQQWMKKKDPNYVELKTGVLNQKITNVKQGVIDAGRKNVIDRLGDFVSSKLPNRTSAKEFLKQSDSLEEDTHLEHHGIKGQKWGVRRFQKKDGQLTKLGKARQASYAKATLRATIRQNQTNAKIANKMAKKADKQNQVDLYNAYVSVGKEYENRASRSKEYLSKIKSKEVEAGKDYVASRATSLSFNWIHGVGFTTTTALKTNSGINAEYRYTIY